MAEDTCKDIRNWEEEIYWRHFRSIHFSQFLNAGFDQRMAIPEKFTRKLSKKLPEVVSLRGPGGGTWKIGLRTNDDKMFFSDGWEEFVKDHVLEENDLLVFKYNGDSQFDVLIFDGESMCEKAASYFVKKHGHESGFRVKRTTGESFVEATIASDNDAAGSQRKRNVDNGDDTTPVRKRKEARVTSYKNWRYDPFRASRIARSAEPSSDREEVNVKPDVAQMSHRINVMRAALRTHARKSALAAVTSDGFIVVMQPTHLKDKYFMNLPVVWMMKHLSLENQDVILRVEGKIWHVRFLCRKQHYQSTYRGAFSSGWRKFAVDNKLRESDLCVFEPDTKSNNLVVLDVQIFRATQ